jgi:hypothetical protein
MHGLLILTIHLTNNATVVIRTSETTIGKRKHSLLPAAMIFIFQPPC